MIRVHIDGTIKVDRLAMVHAITDVVEKSESLSLDDEGDRALLITRLATRLIKELEGP